MGKINLFTAVIFYSAKKVVSKFEKLSNSYTFALRLIKRELSSAGSEHLPYKQRVTGSNPVAPTLKIKGLHESLTLFYFSFANNLQTNFNGIP
jgi:hypothetical protein